MWLWRNGPEQTPAKLGRKKMGAFTISTLRDGLGGSMTVADCRTPVQKREVSV